MTSGKRVLKLLLPLTALSFSSGLEGKLVSAQELSAQHQTFYAQKENPFSEVGITNPLPPSPEYKNISCSYNPKKWQNLWEGASFQRVDIYRNQTEKVDTIAIVRFDPRKTAMRIISGCPSPAEDCEFKLIEEWRQDSNYAQEENIVLVNSSYYLYESSPFGQPETFFVRDGVKFGRAKDQNRGMLQQSLDGKLDILDSKYDPSSEFRNPRSSWAVQSWPVLKDREGNIRVRNSLWQANRTIAAKDDKGYIYVMTTEGGFFTLHNFGKFVKDLSNYGLNLVTTMNLDGGYEADMLIETPQQTYFSYGHFETQGPKVNISLEVGYRIKIPTAIAFLPK